MIEEMRGLALEIIEQLQHRGVDYGDVRVENVDLESIAFRKQRLAETEMQANQGIGIRVLVNGCWGFASCSGFEAGLIEKTVDRAVDVAKSGSCAVSGMVKLSIEKPETGHYAGPCVKNPFEIPRTEKIDLLSSTADIIHSSPLINMSWSYLWFERRKRVFGNTEGTLISSDLTFTQPILIAYAVHNDDMQSRSLQDGARIAGWEWIEQVDMIAWAEKAREEAIMKVKAPEGPSGVMDLVLDGLHLSLTMHESVGHPTESDRVLGWEANMAGRTFLEISDQEHLKYGSSMVNFIADNTIPYGVASWGWDDDGVPGQKWYTIKNGIFQEFGSVRETALLVERQHSRGCCRAMDFACFPINRQPNFYLEPGTEQVTPDDLISEVEKGVYIEGRGSFSIDQRRVNFQFGGDLFWEIRNGKKVQPLKKVIYRSKTRDFWGSCDGISDKRFFRAMGLLTCGKGEPVQSARMTHGASVSRFRNIEVGRGAE
ncbi:MAG: TldD/PmbA family protein [Candidatus Aegiribacteria sp.]|nr:TldD/PmbA family protein [Candidatus Aegiribacteria sp.]